MKYKTFRALVLTGVLAVGLGLGWAFRGCSEPAPPDPRGKAGKTVAGRKTPRTPTKPASPTAPVDPDALRAVDTAILSRVKLGMSGKKVKDALKGRAWKVNLYQDPGANGAVSRLKLDLDRDGKWDEKWAFEGEGKVKRQAAPADDENYTAEYRLRGNRWVFKEARKPTPTPRPTATTPPAPTASREPQPRPKGEALRPIDRDVLDALDVGISGKKTKDAFANKPIKVSLYQDADFINRLKLDLDRDGKWDEKWTISREGGVRKIKRKVAPNDDDQYTVEYRLREGVWVRK